MGVCVCVGDSGGPQGQGGSTLINNEHTIYVALALMPLEKKCSVNPTLAPFF